jgi:hypothetical protein
MKLSKTKTKAILNSLTVNIWEMSLEKIYLGVNLKIHLNYMLNVSTKNMNNEPQNTVKNKRAAKRAIVYASLAALEADICQGKIPQETLVELIL